MTMLAPGRTAPGRSRRRTCRSCSTAAAMSPRRCSWRTCCAARACPRRSRNTAGGDLRGDRDDRPARPLRAGPRRRPGRAGRPVPPVYPPAGIRREEPGSLREANRNCYRRLPRVPSSRSEPAMLTTTRDMILPTAITGSYPRPLWFDRSLAGPLVQDDARRFAVPRAVSRRGRRDHQRAGSGRARHRDRRRQPLRSRGRRQVLVLLSDRAAGRRQRPPRHLARLDAAPGRGCGRAKSCGRCRRPISPVS